MNYVYLGASGLRVSRLCLGTVNFGWRTEEAAAIGILDRAHALGLNFVDTADSYGGSWGKGGVEALLGRWFSGDGLRRERTVLATKVFNPSSDWPNDGGLSALHIRRACEASLRRLNTDYIDVYQMHYPDPGTPWEETWEALDDLRTQGKILYVGASNVAASDIRSSQEQAQRLKRRGLVAVQAQYNLLAREVEEEILPMCESNGIGMLAWSPLAGGVLAGVVDMHFVGDRRHAESAANVLTERRDVLMQWEGLCAEVGVDPPVVALSWLLCRPGVTGVIAGPRTVEQLEHAATALDFDLTDEVQRRIELIFGGESLLAS